MFLKSLFLSLLLVVSSLAHAGKVDSIEIVIGFSPGGGSDRIARNIQEILSKETGKSVIIGYKPGVGGDIASRQVANDNTGQTVLLLKGTSNIVMRQLRGNTVYNYDQLKPVAYIGYVPMVLVSSVDSKFKTLDDILNLSTNEHPDFGSSGVGSGTHVSAELFFNRINRTMTHIPYKGNSQVLVDLLGGRLDLTWGFPVAVVPLIQEGKLNAIAIAGSNRLTSLPDIPTLDEKNLSNGYGKLMYVLYASPGTSTDVVSRIQAVLYTAFSNPSVSKIMSDNADVTVEPLKTLEVQQILDGEFNQYQELVLRSPGMLSN